jgi:Protein of unknown function (DUF3105)
VSKKLQDKRERRLAEQRRREAQRKAARRGNLVTVAVVVVVVAVVAGVVIQQRLAESAPVGVAAGEAGCTPIETHEIEGNQHVDEGTEVDYQTTPPSSGNHYETPADPGFYSSEVPAETLVHNLEHGQIVFWYRPDAPQEVADDLERIVGDGGVALLAVPSAEVPDGANFAMSAWGATQACERVSQVVIDRFRERYQGNGPEQVGVPTFEA